MTQRHFVKNLILLWLLLVGPAVTPALAVQSHGGAEGLVAHQLAHLLLAIGMGALLFHSVRLRLNTQGWPYFKAFTILSLLWNLQTFANHWLNEASDFTSYIKEDGLVTAYVAHGFADVFFYLSHLDHLLLVPALIMLLLALRRWRMAP